MNTEEDPGTPHWNVFLLTFNAATTTELIGEAGGTVLFEPMVVPTRGVIGMAVDATGAVVGYWSAVWSRDSTSSARSAAPRGSS